jgi:hypothetical protein
MRHLAAVAVDLVAHSLVTVVHWLPVVVVVGSSLQVGVVDCSLGVVVVGYRLGNMVEVPCHFSPFYWSDLIKTYNVWRTF